MLSKATSIGNLVSMRMCRGIYFSTHILYADDVLLFCKATLENCVTLSRIFAKYAAVFEQNYNPSKIRVYFGNAVSPAVRSEVRDRLQFIVGSFPFTYLGVPIFRGDKCSAYC